ncbi:hypothetical protein BD309DRAFT_359672 [Dichomitus squalens]|uniref:Uncharacterized protein n=1 Tax=Dichomitus squalens TaxID=114155 RepID=A0A4Q9Q9U3_9APHY|nr:hypothetical protein BD309DRAFT_359672 [Dichomitus squalens]TBU64403.1 hypothetical protein BD310DRAFT_396080 [Dichomitus squalens]
MARATILDSSILSRASLRRARPKPKYPPRARRSSQLCALARRFRHSAPNSFIHSFVRSFIRSFSVGARRTSSTGRSPLRPAAAGATPLSPGSHGYRGRESGLRSRFSPRQLLLKLPRALHSTRSRLNGLGAVHPRPPGIAPSTRGERRRTASWRMRIRTGHGSIAGGGRAATLDGSPSFARPCSPVLLVLHARLSRHASPRRPKVLPLADGGDSTSERRSPPRTPRTRESPQPPSRISSYPAPPFWTSGSMPASCSCSFRCARWGGGRTQPIARHISVTALGPRAARSVGDLATQNPVLSARCSGAICTDATDAKPRPPTRAACLWV